MVRYLLPEDVAKNLLPKILGGKTADEVKAKVAKYGLKSYAIHPTQSGVFHEIELSKEPEDEELKKYKLEE